jgi:hypothetical protein
LFWEQRISVHIYGVHEPCQWIAIYIYSITHLKDYVDNVFSFELADQTLYYPPHQSHYPAKHTHLLNLWEELGIPHDKEKQEFRPTLCVISLDIDPNAMTVTMDIKAHNELIRLIKTFAIARKKYPQRVSACCRSCKLGA